MPIQEIGDTLNINLFNVFPLGLYFPLQSFLNETVQKQWHDNSLKINDLRFHKQKLAKGTGNETTSANKNNICKNYSEDYF